MFYNSNKISNISVVKHQTELDPFAAFIKNSQTGRVKTSKQGNGDRVESQAGNRGRRIESESSKQSKSGQAENNQKRDNSPRPKGNNANTGNNAQ